LHQPSRKRQRRPTAQSAIVYRVTTIETTRGHATLSADLAGTRRVGAGRAEAA
jgi:hypothetical protein